MWREGHSEPNRVYPSWLIVGQTCNQEGTIVFFAINCDEKHD